MTSSISFPTTDYVSSIRGDDFAMSGHSKARELARITGLLVGALYNFV